ncbi:hypothetical protein Cmaq_0194 [Caldivirga maquilingensis IC-167]|uniref:Uncharacterized protein n=1 Tax=Caldivirga maquilingensis (strain ATCC 700844 / DSM 13496 / JCM 10307 / IC-167) TaxID=397948 RepID=A8MAB1_CALMQ|nr:hypothetical protein Cmaq_0194 [Caldivirga maquilingensis IC-167]
MRANGSMVMDPSGDAILLKKTISGIVLHECCNA